MEYLEEIAAMLGAGITAVTITGIYICYKKRKIKVQYERVEAEEVDEYDLTERTHKRMLKRNFEIETARNKREQIEIEYEVIQ